MLDSHTVQISWDPEPAGTSAVIEVNRLGEASDQVVGTASNTGPFTDTEIDPNSYAYRVKFVHGNNESPYSIDILRVSTGGFLLTPHARRRSNLA